MRNLSRPLKDKVPAAPPPSPSPPPPPQISSTKGSATATAPSDDGGDNDPVARLAKLLKAIYYLQLVEILGLVLISFIHNREHYREFRYHHAQTGKLCKLYWARLKGCPQVW